MLAEAIIRIGRPIKNSDMPCRDKIRLLTDVSSENCKNFFRHVFLLEITEKDIGFQLMEVGNRETKEKKETFQVDSKRNVTFPIFYPNGGNPLHAQGIYPLPCYLMYDPHIKAMKDKEAFKKEFLLPRLGKTLGYRDRTEAERVALADRIAELLAARGAELITEDKQLGVMMIFDQELPMFHRYQEKRENEQSMWIAESPLTPGAHLHLDGEEVLKRIGRAKFYEAAELGKEKNALSTFTNRKTDEVVSIYNKSWLWLSPTWESPRSIYWNDDEWTKGIKVDEESYAAYLYGVQFLKEIQVPISSAVLKEMFAPITSVEAKKTMSMESFESIYGIPLVLPLTDGDSRQLFAKYQKLLKKRDEKQSDGDLQLKVLAGIDRIVPEMGDEHRLTILYYSGDLSRGNMHIRAMIQDVIPSVAGQVEKILYRLSARETGKIQEAFGVREQPVYRTQNLPALLANVYGPGYVWESLRSVFHKEPLRWERLHMATARKLNESANREDRGQMLQELVFHYSFLCFLKEYEEKILHKQGGVRTLADWDEFINLYNQGELKLEHLKNVEDLGFVSGLLLKQFHNSYYQKKKNENPKIDFIKHRVMKFGSKLTPEMIWKNGLLRCEEIDKQLEMNMGKNFYPVLAYTLLGFIEKKNLLITDKDLFMTAFWSGNLLYKKNNEDGSELDEKMEKTEEDGGMDNE